MVDGNFTIAFEEFFKKLAINYEQMMPIRDISLADKLTMKQFQLLAMRDVHQSVRIAESLEDIMSDYRKCLEAEKALISSKTALFEKMKLANITIEKEIEQNEEEQRKLNVSDYDFLQAPNQEPPEKEKPAEFLAFKQPLPEPPVYLSQRFRPPDGKYEASSSRPLISRIKCNLDDSVLNSEIDDSVQYGKVEKRLEFDDDREEDESHQVLKKTPTVLHPRDYLSNSNGSLYDLPPPPVFKSRFGQQYNKSK